MIKTIILIAVLAFSSVQATIVELGQINLTGNFTLNHSYNWNQPSTAPYGKLGTMTVQNSTGIFGPTIDAGDTLGVNTPFVFGPSTPVYYAVSSPMIWNIGGFTFNTQTVGIAGAGWVGHFVHGETDLSYHGFEVVDFPQEYPGLFSSWNFTAPPYDISNNPVDITGPVNLQVSVKYSDGLPNRVPDTGSTLAMLGMALTAIVGLRYRFSI